MQVARVVGTVVCSHKDEGLSGVTLLVIQPLAKDGAAVRPHAGGDRRGRRRRRRGRVLRPRRRGLVPVPSAHRPDRRLDCRHRGLGVYLTSPADMQIATVVGTVVATKKHAALDGAKLLLVQPETPEGEARGPVLLAIDSVGAGVGERVLVVIEGKAAGDALGRRGAPVDAAIVGIIDRVDDTTFVDVAPVEAA